MILIELMCKHIIFITLLIIFSTGLNVAKYLNERPPNTFNVWPNSPVRSGEIVLMAAAFSGLRSLCLAINKSLWITGEAGSQCSCVRVWAGQWNDWSSGGLSARKNAVW